MKYRKQVNYIISTVLIFISFLLIIPPVQSSPETSINFLPNGFLVLLLFIVGSIIKKRNGNSFASIIVNSIAFFIYAWLVFSRIKLGVL